MHPEKDCFKLPIIKKMVVITVKLLLPCSYVYLLFSYSNVPSTSCAPQIIDPQIQIEKERELLKEAMESDIAQTVIGKMFSSVFQFVTF